MSDRPATVLAGISTDLLVRAGRTDNVRDLLEAFEIAEHALRYEPRNTVALFNQARALQQLGFMQEAMRGRSPYLTTDAASELSKALSALRTRTGPGYRNPPSDTGLQPLRSATSADRVLAALAVGLSPPRFKPIPNLPSEPRGLISRPREEVRVEYTLIADTLFIWTFTETHAEQFRTAVDTTLLFEMIREVEAKLQGEASEGEIRPVLTTLYEYLIRPFAPRVSPGIRLVIHAEGRLGKIPFAALYDGQRNQYLVEDYGLRVGSNHPPLSSKSVVTSAVDREVMRKLAVDSVSAALDYLDRSRTTLALTSTTSRPAWGRISAPLGETGVEYGLVADTLLIWTITGQHVEVFRSNVDTLLLFTPIRQTEAALVRQKSDAAVHPLLSILYDWLLRPIKSRLGVAGTPLVFVLDERLASIPFAALYDRERRRYFMDDHEIRFATSLEIARGRETARPARGVALIADPAFDQRQYPGLERVPHARIEVLSIAPGYIGATVLDDTRATRTALDSVLGEVSLIHFANHAVFDEAHPERSFLVLAPGPGAAGKITAEELSHLDLRHVQLVVLAGCQTARSGRTLRGNFSGLSDAVLAAGAGGVVGSTWNVDDRLTAALMIEFHRHYQRSRDGPAALREAQLALRRSPDPTLRSPAAWAGFRYMGR